MMKKNLGWLLLVIILILVLLIAYAFSTQSTLGVEWSDTFYDYLSGTYSRVQPPQ